MKCSSRRNCNEMVLDGWAGVDGCLNEVQLPKELQPGTASKPPPTAPGLNEVQLPKELQPRAPCRMVA